ncbi:MAG: porin family protein [Bacteroidota bacterium]
MRYFITAVFLLLLVKSAEGQQFQLGLKTGLNFSTLHFEIREIDIYKPRIGGHIGGSLSLNIGRRSSIKTELLYSTEGARFKEQDDFIRINRFSIPVLFNYHLTDKLRVESGLGFKFQINARSKSEDELDDLFTSTDVGISLGLEYTITERLGVSIRNYFGLTYQELELIDQLGLSQGLINGHRSNVLSISMGYLLIR